jgi:glycosyltransferase involved in cell wall biosynthesis
MNAPGAPYATFVSIVAPLRDAAEYVEPTVSEIDRIARASFGHYEIVLVDDASRDDTVSIVQNVQQRIENVQLYCLNRRGGFDVALTAGLDNSLGDFVITLNVDTDPVALIPSLWEMGQQGNEVVCGVRLDLKRKFLGLRNRMFYRVFEAATGLKIPLGASDLRLYSRRVVKYIVQNNDRHLLVKVLAFFTSHHIATLEYEPLKPKRGRGKRSLISGVLTSVTIILASSIRPLRLLTIMAVMASFFSLLFAAYVLGVALFKRDVVEGWISLALPMAVMFFFISTILGMISEYIYMLAQQSGNRPMYSISKESVSSVLEIQRKLNVVEGSGDLATLTGGPGAGPGENQS